MKRILGRMALAVTLGCWSVALWAVFLGTGHTVQLGHDLLWWPGSTSAILVAVLAYILLQALPTLSDPLHRATGRDGVPTWALLAAAALSGIVVVRWGAALSHLAALELFALGTASLWVAGLTAPAPAPDAGLARPPLAPGPAELGEADEHELVWTDRRSALAEPYVVRARVDRAGLLSQRESAHNLPEHRWGEYAAVTPAVRALARDLRAIAEEQGFDPIDEVRLVAGLAAGGLKPASPEAGDRPLYPLETLAEPLQTGPTARTTLAGAILAALGYRPALLKAGDRVALSVTGAAPLPGLFLDVGGEPAIYIDSSHCGETPPEARAVPWLVLRIG